MQRGPILLLIGTPKKGPNSFQASYGPYDYKLQALALVWPQVGNSNEKAPTARSTLTPKVG